MAKISKEKSKSDLTILFFENQKKWRNWLLKNYQNTDGIWLRLYKKDSGIKSINHEIALDEALCFGWIDGQAKKYDEVSYLHKFTPRRKKSLWSKRNVKKAQQLIKEGKMHKSGFAEIEAAKADGRWEKAYDSPSNMKVPEDFLKELYKKPEALAFYKTLNKTNIFSIIFRLQTAKKPETRERRMKTIIKMLEAGKKFQ